MRSCGKCTACCTAMGVVELRKPTFRDCRHACAQGCGIYAKRPGSCRSFRCLWLDGHLAEGDRPDKLGVILTMSEHPDYGRVPMFTEFAPGALLQARVQQAMAKMLQRTPIVTMTRRGRTLLTPMAGDAGMAQSTRRRIALPVLD